MNEFDKAQLLLHGFKGDTYLFGASVLPDVGKIVAHTGNKTALIRSTFKGSDSFVDIIKDSLRDSGVELVAEIKGARPNCPREDLFRITEELKAAAPEVLISFGGGSTIDAAKAAEVLAVLGGEIDDYFGTGLVTDTMKDRDKTLVPHVAIQTAAGSAAHLTKYSNVTDISTGQKKLIVDDVIVPDRPVFDYEVTYNAPENLTLDGAFDGVSHSLEVLYGAVGKPVYNKSKRLPALAFLLWSSTCHV